jgi:hypothetical protein
MKAFFWTTGIVFALITIVHIWRVFAESTSLAKDPWFVLISLVAAGLSVWSFRLLRSTRSR